MRVWLVAALFAGCVSPEFGRCTIRCGANAACPSGLACAADGFCHAEGEPECGAPADGGGADAAVVDAPLPSGPCGTFRLLVDDFGDFDATVWSTPFAQAPGTASVGAGEVRFELTADTSADLTSLRFYDLVADTVVVDVGEIIPDETVTLLTGIRLVAPNGHFIALEHADGNFYSKETVGNTVNMQADEGERDWRFREEFGAVYWEVSADGNDWRILRGIPAPMPLATLRLGLYAFAEGGGGVVSFEGVNRGAPAADFCPVSDLFDDFFDGERGSLWARGYEFGTCQLTETGGTEFFQVEAPEPAGCALATSTSYDLRDDEITIGYVGPCAEMLGVEAFFEVGGAEGFARMRHADHKLYVDVGGMGLVVRDFDPGTMRYWRIQEGGGELIFGVSPTGDDYTEIGRTATPFPVSAVDVSFGVEAPIGVVATAQCAFDDVD